MAVQYTEEQLNNFDKNTLVQLFLSQQNQLEQLDKNMQLVLEQLSDMNRRRFGRSSEKMQTEGQLTIDFATGDIYIFNEAELLADEDPEDDGKPVVNKNRKKKGKKAADLSKLHKSIIRHDMTDDDLKEFFGEESYKQLPDEIYNRYLYIPAKVEVEEHHVAVYSGKTSERMIKAPHPKHLLRNSLASPSVVAGIMNAKYVNALPLARIESEYQRNNLDISRQTMANWTIQCAERYLAVLYDYLHKEIYNYHVLQADETPLLVNKDGRPAGSKSYMWVYRTSLYDKEKPIVLYDYQRTRNASHPRDFLKEFQGICVTDGYQVYHTIESEREDLKISGCWAHARRRFDEALKSMPSKEQKSSVAYKALRMIQAIYREEEKLKDLSATERQAERALVIEPLVEAYFAWVHKIIPNVLTNSKTYKGLSYSINQEKYLKVFLTDGDVPIDNNAAERAIRPFCVGKKNWVMADTISGAQASAIAYSIAETAKANKLKPYEYFKYLLEVIPQHMDDTGNSFIKDLLPWSKNLPKYIRK
jgi:transposase